MNILRKLVITANISLFGYSLWFVSEEGLRGSELVSFLGILLLMILNTYFVVSNKRSGDTWLGLLLERKALEEKKKIKDLENK